MSLGFAVSQYGVAKGLHGLKMHKVRITFDNAYTDGGYAITAANCGYDSQLISMTPMGIIHDATTTSAETGYYTSFDATLGKLQVFNSGGGAASDPPGEVADNFATINTLVCDFMCWGL